MANEYIRKQFGGGAAATTLATSISAGSTSIVVAAGTTYPDATYPFVISIGSGSTQEKVLISARATHTMTAVERGYDGTTAVAHTAGEVIEHVLDANTVEQINRHANTWTTAGDILTRGATYPERVALGTTGYPLVAGASALGYAQLGTAGIADAAVTVAKMAADAWPAWTPTLVQGVTVAKTTVATWLKTHREARFRATLTATASGTAANAIVLGLPVATSATYATNDVIGYAYFLDASAAERYFGALLWASSTTAKISTGNVGPTLYQGNNDFIAAIASGDTVSYYGFYETAS